MKKLRSISKKTWFNSLIFVFLAMILALNPLAAITPQPAAASQEAGATQIETPSCDPEPPSEVEQIETAAKPQRPEPQKTAVLVSPDKDFRLTSPGGNITLDIPAGAVTENARVEFLEHVPWGSTGMQILNLFELNAFAVDRADAEVTRFGKDLTITIKHSPEDLRGLDPASLRLYCLNEKTTQWDAVASSKYDPVTMTLTATIDHFSYYGEQASPAISGPGRIMAAQVNLSSGTATYSYPIDIPPGRGGLQPSIGLVYNSGSADEMKNKRDVGSWVGIGWSLKLGSISYNEADDEYFLDINGASYRLVETEENTFHTIPESFYKITRTADGYGSYDWYMYDRDGIKYRFGYGDGTSQQKYLNGFDTYYHFYRWDLDYVWDVHTSNYYYITYVQDQIFVDNPNGPYGDGWSVRSAYPSSLKYNNNMVEIKFNSSYDTNDDDGPLRDDNPDGTVVNPAPKVVENRKLDSIEVKYNGSLVRKYTFTYNTTDCSYSANYGGIYYSGKHTLSSITEVGADGSSTLPATTFTYSDLYTRLDDTTQSDYSGNPGNPATFSWPHLVQINNGYGASVGFSYAEKPSSTAQDIWTREVVTTKVILPGIGYYQFYNYTYTGDPQYLDDTWDSEYRGFSQVKETDAASNYVKHYFYTTGSFDEEYLTGREYKTEWYDSSNNLLKKVENDIEHCTYDFGYTRLHRAQTQNGLDVAIDTDGYVYVSDDTYVNIYDQMLAFQERWSHGCQTQTTPEIAMNGDAYIYVVDNNYQKRVRKFETDGDHVLDWNVGNTIKDIAIDDDGYVYVLHGTSVYKYNGSGSYIGCIAYGGSLPSGLNNPTSIDVNSNGYVYVLDGGWGRVMIYTTSGSYVTNHLSGESLNNYFVNADKIAVDPDGYHYVTSYNNERYVEKYLYDGQSTDYILAFNADCGDYDYTAHGMAVHSGGEVVLAGFYSSLRTYFPTYAVQNSQIDVQTGDGGSAKTSRTRYIYDDYGNVVTQYLDGDISTSDDDATIHRVFYPNTTANILNRPARERVYQTITGDVGGSNLKAETKYYYDNNNTSLTTPPTKGDLTRLQQYKDASDYINTYYTYDSYGNQLTVQDPNGETTTLAYSSSYQYVFPTQKTYPTVGGLSMYETYAWNAGSGKITGDTDVNDCDTSYYYDTFQRLVKVVKPGDTSEIPTIEYQYNNWGTINQQHLKTISKIDGSDSLWQSDYFDGLGRVVQTHAEGESGYTIIASTTTYNTRGFVDKEYVSQNLSSGSVSGYYTPGGAWKYTTYAYDGLGRVTTQTNYDSTTIGYDYSVPWRNRVTNERGYKHNYYYDAFDRLVKVEELDASHALYATTTYEYDILGNLIEVGDEDDNTTTISYDRLSRKTSMSDPDMGSWSYTYDSNGNLATQTDARSQTITFSYDDINRLTGKTYSGDTYAGFTYDSTTGDNIGKGRRTGMSDDSGSTTYKYDCRGRLIEETRNIDSVNYTTEYTYDSADRLVTITYPTGETVTQTYNGRGFPYSLSGSTAGNIVNTAYYNQLGEPTEMNLQNGVKTIFGYYGTGGAYDTTGGYYGRLWQIKSTQGANVRQEMRHTWDASGNLAWRQDVKFGGLEYCTYDFLDRLTAVSSAYSHSYSYDEIGNIVSMNGSSYTYGSKPHAVTDAGEAEYTYDANGNMVDRDGTTITWDVENRPTAVGSATFVYDGDGNRVKKTEGGQTTIYINKYYEKNTSTGTVTTYYYLGGRLVALRNGSNLRYVHQDHLGGTNVVTDTSGSQLGYTRYYPFGSTRNSSGSLDTDKKFTGQRLDGTGLYYYGARFYDPTLGRFISPDTIVPDFNNPQALNRYTYAFNNPFKYIDPTGHWPSWSSVGNFFKGVGNAVVNTAKSAVQMVVNPVQTAKAIGHAITNPVETFNAIKNDYVMKSKSAEGIGEIFGDILLTVATGGAGGAAIKTGGKVIASVVEKGAVKAIVKGGAELATSQTLRGSRNPIIRAAIETGHRAHRVIKGQLGEEGYLTEQRLPLRDGSWVRVDAIKGDHIIEIKPNTPTGIRSGEARLDLLRQNGYNNVDIYYYNPAEF